MEQGGAGAAEVAEVALAVVLGVEEVVGEVTVGVFEVAAAVAASEVVRGVADVDGAAFS